MEDSEHESSKESVVSPRLSAPHCPDGPAWLTMHFMLSLPLGVALGQTPKASYFIWR